MSTHLCQQRTDQGDIALLIDLRRIGSNGGLYADTSENYAFRASQLVVDVIEEIHSQLRSIGFTEERFGGLVKHLDDLAAAATEIHVLGPIEITEEGEIESGSTKSLGASIQFSRRWSQRPAQVRPAPLVAHVLVRGAVVNALPVHAVRPAPPQLLVQRVQGFSVERPCFQVPHERPNVLLQVAGVHPVSGAPDVERLQVPVEQLVHRRARARVPALVDLVEQLRPRLLSEPGGLRTGRDHLDEVVTASTHRVGAGVDAYTKGAAGQLVDGPALPTPAGTRSRHDHKVLASCVILRVT